MNLIALIGVLLVFSILVFFNRRIDSFLSRLPKASNGIYYHNLILLVLTFLVLFFTLS